MLLCTIASNSLKIPFRGCQQISAARQPLSGMSDNDKVFWDIIVFGYYSATDWYRSSCPADMGADNFFKTDSSVPLTTP